MRATGQSIAKLRCPHGTGDHTWISCSTRFQTPRWRQGNTGGNHRQQRHRTIGNIQLDIDRRQLSEAEVSIYSACRQTPIGTARRYAHDERPGDGHVSLLDSRILERDFNRRSIFFDATTQAVLASRPDNVARRHNSALLEFVHSLPNCMPIYTQCRL